MVDKNLQLAQALQRGGFDFGMDGDAVGRQGTHTVLSHVTITVYGQDGHTFMRIDPRTGDTTFYASESALEQNRPSGRCNLRSVLPQLPDSHLFHDRMADNEAAAAVQGYLPNLNPALLRRLATRCGPTA